MTPQKLLRIASFVILTSIALPASSAMMTNSPNANNPAMPADPKIERMAQRLEYLNGLDKSEMTRLEKKNMRKEVKGIKKEMKEIGGGVYLSVVAIIIIILLLILLL